MHDTHHVIDELRVRRLVIEDRLIVVDRSGRVAGSFAGFARGAELVIFDSEEDGVFVSLSAGNTDPEIPAPANLVIADGVDWLELDARH